MYADKENRLIAKSGFKKRNNRPVKKTSVTHYKKDLLHVVGHLTLLAHYCNSHTVIIVCVDKLAVFILCWQTTCQSCHTVALDKHVCVFLTTETHTVSVFIIFLLIEMF